MIRHHKHKHKHKRKKKMKQYVPKPPKLDTFGYVCKSPIEGGPSYETWMKWMYGYVT